VAGLTLTVAAFVVAVIMTMDASKPHFSNVHTKLGLAVTLFGVLQPLNALVRPHPLPRTHVRKVRGLCRCFCLCAAWKRLFVFPYT
jgi:hypothetical protein